MKKLMIAACAIAMAVVANAATYAWDASYVMDGYDTGSAAVNGQAYLFLNSGDTALATISQAVADGLFTDGTTYTGLALDTAAIADGAIGATSAEGKAGATGNSFYMVLVGNDGSKDYAYVSPTYTPDTVATIGATVLSFVDDPENTDWGLWTSTSAAANWTAQGVPEPTSGLLLLIGMAGLALRRRRA